MRDKIKYFFIYHLSPIILKRLSAGRLRRVIVKKIYHRLSAGELRIYVGKIRCLIGVKPCIQILISVVRESKTLGQID